MEAQERLRPTRAQLAKIHIAKRDLGLTDEDYRAMLVKRFQVFSSADLTRIQASSFIIFLMGEGWREKTRQRRTLARSPQSRKIRALWITLSQMGKVNDSSEKALASYVRRMTGVDALQWLSMEQAWRVIESLKAWQKRAAAETIR